MRDKIISFNDKHFPNWRDKDPYYYTNALIGELGEFCNALKHYQGGGTNRTHIELRNLWLELIDVQIYLILLMERLGMHEKATDACFDYKMSELVERMQESLPSTQQGSIRGKKT